MRLLLPMVMMALVLIGSSLGDDMPLLNAYELLRSSGVSILPEAGTRYIADQEKLGKAALPAAWMIWVLVSALISAVSIRLWRLVR